MVDRVPQSLLDAAREPFLAQAVIYLLLLSRDDKATWTRQAQLLQTQLEQPLYQQMQQLAAAILDLPTAARLPLVDLTIPALKKCSSTQYVQFRQVVEALVAADGRIDLFEFCLRTVLLGYLDVHFGLKKRPPIRYRSVAAVAQPAAVVLSLLAYVGQQEPADVERAFRCGAEKLLGEAAIGPRPVASFGWRFGRVGPGRPGGEAGGDCRRDGRDRRGRQSDHRGERVVAGDRRRAGLPDSAHPLLT
jgi:hypothetical protein